MACTFRLWVRVDLVAASALLSCIRANLPCQVSTVTPYLRNHQAHKCQGSLLWHPRRMALCIPNNAQVCCLVCPSVPMSGRWTSCREDRNRLGRVTLHASASRNQFGKNESASAPLTSSDVSLISSRLISHSPSNCTSSSWIRRPSW